MSYVTEGEQNVEKVGEISFQLTEGLLTHSHLYGDYILNANWGRGLQKICYFGTWAFSSCAVGSFCGFTRNYTAHEFWKEEACVEAFVQWLKKPKSLKEVFGDYNPKEYYFLLSNDKENKLREHSLVKKVDAFENKSHSSSGVSLYRLSLMKDF